MSSLSECIPWMTVGSAESVAIVTLNLCTIIVFTKNPNLRKRSTHLLINLAVIDMLAGGSAVYYQLYVVGATCDVWKWHSFESWPFDVLQVVMSLLPTSSLANITIIALERTHATFWAFRHRVLKKSVYGIIVAVFWATTGLVAVAYTLLKHFGELSYLTSDLTVSLVVVCLLIIFVSYVSIVIKVRCGAQPQHHGAASRERKLTMTLLIVTVVSLLLYLPIVIFYFLQFGRKFEILQSLYSSEYFNLSNGVITLYFANNLVNPILYAIRMPEYRSALLSLFPKRPHQQRRVVDLPLRDM
ncbi:allatostatin-A receptor-like [Orbicella faveolata]|uniref:allatostatin-A receptor-like n=1 Tax=Orbicella faveolata TaxID=48498 RepID=UPI0009E404C4|nr:allatostatin-A receptor-like [Orbicella faveolata]